MGNHGLEFSLFFFSAQDAESQLPRYAFLLDAARFADAHEFASVWTPERHFHRFGGLYPTPAVLGAALAVATERLGIRAGSVVLPLHDTLRVAESWSVVDNLSHGRVGVSLASGYVPNDFVLRQSAFPTRRERMWEELPVLQRLWRGDAVTLPNGEGQLVAIRLFPRPVQTELPIWITAVSEETFPRAGALGFNILTALVTQTVEQLRRRILLYRNARQAAGFDPNAGVVTLMVHTFVGETPSAVRAAVHAPFLEYLRANLDLLRPLARGRAVDVQSWSPRDFEALLEFAFERYLTASSLMGTPDACRATCETLERAGVNELGCLTDFGVETDAILASLPLLNRVRFQHNAKNAIRVSA